MPVAAQIERKYVDAGVETARLGGVEGVGPTLNPSPPRKRGVVQQQVHTPSPLSPLFMVIKPSFQSVERAQHMSRMIASRSSYLGLSYINRQLFSARYRRAIQ